MQRLRLKADGRIVKIRDGKEEFPLAPSMPVASAAPNRVARSAPADRRGAMQFVEANGARIPATGSGTWELRGRTCARLVEQALKFGYRHIDTAQDV